MRLRELEARFLKVVSDNTMHDVDTLAEADGVQFLCPKCFIANKGRIGTHSVICWFLHVPMNIQPGPGRWKAVGTGIDDLTFVSSPGKSNSVALLGGGCAWHGFLDKGDAT